MSQQLEKHMLVSCLGRSILVPQMARAMLETSFVASFVQRPPLPTQTGYIGLALRGVPLLTRYTYHADIPSLLNIRKSIKLPVAQKPIVSWHAKDRFVRTLPAISSNPRSVDSSLCYISRRK